MSLAVMLSRSDALHAALAEAVGELDDAPVGVRGSVAMDALMVAAQHGLALRLLMAEDLGVSGMGVLRMQYEAVLRAVWGSTPKPPEIPPVWGAAHFRRFQASRATTATPASTPG